MHDPTQPAPCPNSCEHTDAEHRAWDDGVEAGIARKEMGDNPYHESSLADAWEYGRAFGALMYRTCEDCHQPCATGQRLCLTCFLAEELMEKEREHD